MTNLSCRCTFKDPIERYTEKVRFVEVEHQDNLPFSKENFNSIKEATATDASLMMLRKTTMQGGLENRSLICKEGPYYNFKDKITVGNGVTFRDRIGIPKSTRPTMKQSVRAGHTGINSCLLRARTYLYSRYI